jgi:hypothetical protein
MAAPRSREAVVNALAHWLSTLKARDIGIRGKLTFLPDRSTRSSLVISVQDDHETEVIEYQITVREVLTT